MKKTYVFEIKKKIQWPKTRCPNCNNGWIETWQQIEPDPMLENEFWPFRGEWHLKCPECGLSTITFFQKRNAKRAWKDMCKNWKDNEDYFLNVAKE